MKKGQELVALRVLHRAAVSREMQTCSSCCGTGTGSWSKGKALISGIVIVAAVVVGAQFLRERNLGPIRQYRFH